MLLGAAAATAPGAEDGMWWLALAVAMDVPGAATRAGPRTGVMGEYGGRGGEEDECWRLGDEDAAVSTLGPGILVGLVMACYRSCVSWCFFVASNGDEYCQIKSWRG